MMPDPRRLRALALAQGGAFAAVLIVAAFSGSGSGPKQVTNGSSSSPSASSSTTSPTSPSPSPSPSTQSPTPTATPDVTFSVTVEAVPSAPKSGGSGATQPVPPADLLNRPVAAVDPQHLTAIKGGSGNLGAADIAQLTVPAGHPYLVCAEPAGKWLPTAGESVLPHNWICASEAASAPSAAPLVVIIKIQEKS